MKRFVVGLAAILATGFLAQAEAAGRHGACHRCPAHARPTMSSHLARGRGRAFSESHVQARTSGRVITPILPPAPIAKPAPLPRADFTQRPVQPGKPPLPAYLPNNAPPVFEQQPLN